MEKSLLDITWVLICSALVLIMQAGFTSLECGLSRKKNNINVAIKNMTDLGLSLFLFWIFGYGLMFGTHNSSWFSTIQNYTPSINEHDAWATSFFLYHAMFAATSLTVISGAIAERVRYVGYIIITILVSGLIYPLFGQMAWNGANYGIATGWLGMQGFVDFAGSTVVHSVGGWAALALLFIIGPRDGRFSKGEAPREIPGSNLSISILGVLILWFGWFGFNGGSTLAMNYQVPKILLNTVLAGSLGAGVALHMGWVFKKRADIILLMNGSLAGLVAITAGCHVVSTFSAVIIGGVAGIIMYFVKELLEKIQIDDVVGAIPVHLGAGVWGTLAVALFGDLEVIGTGLTRMEQFRVQLLGIVVCFGMAFGLTYVIFRLINRVLPLRVSPEDERLGLNITEHGASSDFFDLLEIMDRQEETQDLSTRAPEEPFTEVGQIAQRYNKLMSTLEKTVTETKAIIKDIRDGIFTFSQNGILMTLNPATTKILKLPVSDMVGESVETLLKPFHSQLNKSDLKKDFQFSNFGLALNQKYSLVKNNQNSNSFFELTITEGKLGPDPFYTGIIRDVTEDKNTELKIKEEAENLQRFQKVTVNRESKMIELKEEINRLRQETGKPIKYKAPYKIVDDEISKNE